MKDMVRKTTIFSLLFTLMASPILLGYQVNNSEFIISPSLLIILSLPFLLGQLNRWGLLILVPLFGLSIIHESPITSLGYYMLGVFMLLNNNKLGKIELENAIETLIVFLLVTILLDYINPNIINSVSGFERRIFIDNRIKLTEISRPVGFFRENSGLGLFIGSIYFLVEFYQLKVRKKLLFSIGILSLSASFLLTLLLVYVLFNPKKIFNRYIIIFISILIVVVIIPRIKPLFELINSPTFTLDEIKYIPLSVIKRYWHPPMALIDFIGNFQASEIAFGIGPGNYKNYLQSEYRNIAGSDLRAGFILNSIINFIFSYGILLTSLILIILHNKKEDKRYFWFIIFLLIQGVPLLHPSIFLQTISPKEC